MTTNEIKVLYEIIMQEVSKKVKSLLENFSENSNNILSVDEIDNILLKVKNAYSVNNLPKEELKSMWRDYRNLYNLRKITHYGPDYITESEDLKTDILNFLEELKKRYKFKSNEVIIADFNEIGITQSYIKLGYESPLIDVIIADIDENANIINEFMTERGFYLIRKIKETPNRFLTFSHLMYTPFEQKNILDFIKEKTHFVYHISLSKNDNSILKNGIIAKERNGENNICYPARVYLSYDKDFVKLYKSTLIEDHTYNEYSLFEIDIDKLSNNIKFYLDPLFGKPFIFTDISIPSSAIVKIEHFK